MAGARLSARAALGAAGRAALTFLLPPACAACGRALDDADGGAVCGRCWERLAWLGTPRCPRCGHPGDPRHRCRWCELLPAYVRAARSVCWVHRGTGSAIVHALKYEGWERVAEGMAARLARLDWPVDVRAERDALVPVPLAAARARERGFNQSERLARALGARLGLPVWTDVLTRTRATRTQTRLTPEERRSNVSGAFSAVPDAVRRVRGTHLVLVDDVVTTAATLNACAASLFAAGTRIVSYATFGRAPALGDAA
ncbi:MAG TPA: double zinc ribbon domain-containing protein [Gemmatimonadaceae bacterium]|nr:double zinc ribbon domain-containing protein [Gemmatimonadaceae bacterium]